MFRLEKVFQNDDKFFIFISDLLKAFFVFLTIYIFSILEKNTIYELTSYQIFKNSSYFLFSIYVTIIYYFSSIFFFKKKTNFFQYKNSLNKNEFLSLFTAIIISIVYFKFYLKNNFEVTIIFLILFLSLTLFFIQILISKIYKLLVSTNIIQKNVLIIGNLNSVKKILYEKKNDIYVYKCCIVTDKTKNEIIKFRNELKIPVFEKNEDIRSLLEYHSLGQIWLLNDNKIDLDKTVDLVIKFSVDIIFVNLFKIENNINFINSKYSFEYFEVSKFYGINLLIKIILDKFLSLFFLFLLSPLLVISIILIALEDGFPVFFSQDRTGWDGRRFKIYKLRSLKNVKFKKTDQVVVGDKRLLKIGKFIRKFSIDELPQFYNVLKGDMSIVGPRPHMVEHDIYYSNLLKNFLKRHKSSPGLTGWAQVNGYRGETKEIELMKKRMEHDLWYLNNWSLFLDIKIIFKTFIIIFKHKGV